MELSPAFPGLSKRCDIDLAGTHVSVQSYEQRGLFGSSERLKSEVLSA